jgi:hypothetical protein
MGAALFVSEFGNDPRYDSLILTNELLEQEKHLVGFAFWAWKENGTNTWGVYDASATASSGCIRPARERQLARVYPMASADPTLTFHYDSDSGAFTLHAQGRSGQAPTLIYIPHQVRGIVAAGGAVAGVTTTTDAGGGRRVSVSPSGGAFSVTVGAAPFTLTACS